ncbi:hypothetical protein L1887_20907 [Cichorium endivia]|nr:hypothetical protein L1887_20907 [Cichorium endivia]
MTGIFCVWAFDQREHKGDGVFGFGLSYGGTLGTPSNVASPIERLLIPRGTATEQYHHSMLHYSDHLQLQSQSNQSHKSYPIFGFTCFAMTK